MATRRETDRRRPSARQRGYTSKWDTERAIYLLAHPWCVMCLAKAMRKLATVVDHIIRHNGDLKLFWSRSNWQALCQHCHNSTKQSQERNQ
jgi:5-methylcytosine-specific restriction endonuclease McrA